MNLILQLLVIIFSVMIYSPPILSSQIFPIPKPGCNDSCGNVSIQFPFGTSKHCYLDEAFFINCTNSANGFQPLLGNIPVETILPSKGQVRVKLGIKRDCYHRNDSKDTANSRNQSLDLGASYSINAELNKFIAIGCDTYFIFSGYGRTKPHSSGCMSICSNIKDVEEDGSCSGAGCCKLSMPRGLSELRMHLFGYYNDVSNCSFAFVIEDRLFKFSPENFTNLKKIERLPAILDWTIGNETCIEAQRNSTSYACKENTSCHESDGVLGYRCECLSGYEGNPYLPGGCQDIDECKDHKCGKDSTCLNTPVGSYTCTCNKGFHGDGKDREGCIPDQDQNQRRREWTILGIAVSLGFLLLASCYLYFEFKRSKSIRMKEKFFRENGGILLQQQLSGKVGSSRTARIFTAEELKKATNNFDDSRIIGQGGYGSVYKGFLLDSSTVAIKKSKIVDSSQVDQFVNEVVVLSQVNHRNVVQLLGCCLETEVPLLVYEFISNGTLYEHIHKKRNLSNLSWGNRLRIAAETAGVLSYLHSAAYPPIIHRDVKTANILLDDNYTAKVADFGASRLVPLDQMQLSTIVQGTLGYLDPEYLQTGQLTEKSDVYSFGVVLVELLTGKQVLSSDRPEEERSLAQHFLSSLKLDRLFQVLDHNIVNEENIQQLKEVAILAKRCLNVKGEDRPLMKEVAMELEGFPVIAQHFRGPFEVESAENEAFIKQQPDTFVSGEGSSLSLGCDSILDNIISPVAGGR